jgi:hypothetical protein
VCAWQSCKDIPGASQRALCWAEISAARSQDVGALLSAQNSCYTLALGDGIKDSVDFVNASR